MLFATQLFDRHIVDGGLLNDFERQREVERSRAKCRLRTAGALACRGSTALAWRARWRGAAAHATPTQ